MKLGKRHLPLVAALGAAVAIVPALAAAPPEAKLEVNENCVENAWPCWATPGSGPKPAPASKITIAQGGEVTFTDDSSIKANIAWLGAAPVCSAGVPVSPASPQSSWEGRCRFEQPGTYKFESSTLFDGGPGENYTEYEILVEASATATTTTATTASTATTTAPITGPTITATTTAGQLPYVSPLEGGSGALRLAGRQRGSGVRLLLDLSPAAVGGRLEVVLFAPGASVTRTAHPASVRVGRLLRFPLKAGALSLSLPLDAEGRDALRRHRHLALTLKIALTPLRGATVLLTRALLLRA